ncbi:50S ribosomal protein L32 [Telmatocola sphagniphila]|uniref:Large ribosomal subunit protein bL32 n=1 Tax=Telmatocola sphagniphila TaxID=1123043 RepID=A0A8E6B8G4_9BACT|nr:50S ribosomal protein L32 [Telmatocola sphagniphila]QVL33287.1 50S ribosomal protein L32 [Telmatocola sphagniphila]
MAVPKRRTSHARQGKRRSHLHVTAPQTQFCSNCGEAVLPHHLCSACGHYQKREVVVMEQQEAEGK